MREGFTLSRKEEEEKKIKMLVARIAKELGVHVKPQDGTLQFMETDAAQGCRLFRAEWGAGVTAGALSGLLKDHDDPDIHPGQAMAKIFQRWIETEAKLPDARHMATVAAYLLDASVRHDLILSVDDKAKLIKQREWLPHVRPPQVITVAGNPGIAFWWVGPNGASEVRVYLGEDGRSHTSERFIRDFL